MSVRPGIPEALRLTTLLCVLAVAGAGAQEPDTLPVPPPPDTVRFEIPELEVRTTRPISVSGGASALVVAMDSLETPPSPDLEDVLRKTPLIRVRRNSRGQVQPSIRGVEDRQVSVLVDGVPITLGWDARTDLSVVPVTAVRSVELVRGLSSVLAGPNALGAVVRLETGRLSMPEESSRVRARFQGGTAETWAFSGEAGRVWETDGGRLWIRAGGGVVTRQGLALADGVEQPVEEDDLLINSDRDYGNGFLNLRWEGDGGRWVSLSSLAFVTERGVVPELHLIGSETSPPRFWRIPDHRRSVTSLSGGTGRGETPFGRGRVRATLGLDVQHLEIDAFRSFDLAERMGGEVGDDRNLTLRIEGDHDLGPGLLRGALTLVDTRHEQTEEPDPTADFAQRFLSFGLEVEMPLLPGSDGKGWISKPVLTLGGSVDGADFPETGEFPGQGSIWDEGGRAALSVDVARGAFTVHGGVSRKVRFPAPRELFSGALGRFAPNPGLGPEDLRVAELAATGRLGRHDLQVTLFDQKLDGSIVRDVLPDGRFRRENRGGTESRGLELVANLELGPYELRADLTLQDVELEGAEPGERAEFQPEQSGSLALEGPFRLAGLRGRAELEFVGDQYGADSRTGEFLEIDSSVMLEAGVSRAFSRGIGRVPPFRLTAGVSNVADRTVFDQLGLPRAGRTVNVGLELF